jgi:hypothetical protein
VGIAIVAAASMGLVGAGTGTAISAPHVHKGFVQTAKLKFVISDHGMKTTGPTTFPAGQVAIKLTAKGKNRQVEVGSLADGYTFKHLRKDLTKFGQSFGKNGPTKAGLRHLQNVVDNVTFYGGLAANKGEKSRGTINLSKAGTYIAVNDGGRLPKDPVKLTAAGSALHAKSSTDATVKAVNGARWHGDKNLPAKGTITFKNKTHGKQATPHFIDMERVKKGTTRKDVLDFFQNGHGRPSFARPGSVSTDVVGAGQKMTWTYHTHPGDYALMCFFTDLKTGMPHAFMGMVRIVHLS